MKTNLFTFSHSVKDLTSAHQVLVLDGSRTIVDTTHRGGTNLSLFLLILLTLTFGFTQSAWADSGEFYNVYLKWTYNGTNEAKDLGTSGFAQQNLGTLTSNFNITGVYLKCWDDWGSNFKSEGGQAGYKINSGDSHYISCTRGSKSNNNYEYTNTSTKTIGDINGASGNYTAEFWFQTWGKNWGDRYLNNGGDDKNYKFTYTILPPTVDLVVSQVGAIRGAGTESDPYIVLSGHNLKLTANATPDHTDNNSSVYYTIDDTESSSVKSKTINVISAGSCTIKARSKNTTANLESGYDTKTIYYKPATFYLKSSNGTSQGSKVGQMSSVATDTYTCTWTSSTTSKVCFYVSLEEGNTTGEYKNFLGSGTLTDGTANQMWLYQSDNFQHIQALNSPTSGVPYKFTFTISEGNYYLKCDYPYTGLSVAKTPSDATSSNPTISAKSVVKGGSVSVTTASAKSGYYFQGWTSENGVFDSQEALSTSFTPNASNAIAIANYALQTYDVTLVAGEGGTDGLAKVEYNATALSSINHATKSGFELQGYYTASSGGTKILNNNGTYAQSSYSGWISNNKWSKTENSTLYAQWKATTTTYSYAFGRCSSQTEAMGTVASDVAAGSVLSGTSITVTATPGTGYEVEGWYTDAACTQGKHHAGATQYQFNISANTSVYVKFQEKKYTVNVIGTNTGIESVSPASVSVGQITASESITATAATGYTLAAWTLGEGVIQVSGDKSPITITAAQASSITANATEDLYNVIVTNGTKTSGDKAGIATTVTLKANTAAVGKRFTTWSATGTYSLVGCTLNDETITFNASSEVSFTANYVERFAMRGYKNDDSGKGGLPGWDTPSPEAYFTQVGEAMVYTATLETDTRYKYKVYDYVRGKLCGATGDSDQPAGTEWTLKDGSGNQNAAHFTTTMAGVYTFTVAESSEKYPKITITYPVETKYTVSVSAAAHGQVNVSSVSGVGSYTKSSTITATPNTGYKFKNWTIPEGITIAEGDANSTSIKIYATAADKTIIANFESDWYMYGSTAALGGWTTKWADGAFDTHGNVTVTKSFTLAANTTYEFKMYKASGEKHYWSNSTDVKDIQASISNITLYDNNGNMSFKTTVAGTYTFAVELSNASAPKLSITYPVSYTVSYNGNGNTEGTAPASVLYITGATVTVADNTGSLAKTGYTFGGWNTKADGTGDNYTAGSGTFTITKDTTLYAKWNAKTYTITLSSPDGSPTTQNATATYNQPIDLWGTTEIGQSLTKPTRAGYSLDGYYNENDKKIILTGGTFNSTNYVNWINSKNWVHDDDATLTAVWNANKYNVNFIVNWSGSSETMPKQEHTYDASLALSKCTFTVPTGYTFLGWHTNKDATEALYTDEEEVTNLTTGTAEVKLYAIWAAKEYSITLNAGSYSDITNGTATVKYDAGSMTITAAPTRKGYAVSTLNAYYSDAQCTNRVANNTGTLAPSSTYTTYSKWSYDAQSTINLYTGWTAKTYTITFKPNGGTSAETQLTATFDAKTSIGTCTKPTHATDNFAGYYLNAECTGDPLYNADCNLQNNVSDYTDANGKWIHDGNVDVFAKWTKTYIVTLNNQDATEAGTQQVEVETGKTTGLTTNIVCPTKTGYTFGGYYTTNGGSVQVISAQGVWIIPTEGYIDSDNQWIPTSGATFFAKWTINKTTVKFDRQDATTAGTTSRTLTYNSTQNFDNITCPTKTGYSFNGYFTQPSGAGKQLITSEGAWIAGVAGYTDNPLKWIKTDTTTLVLYASWMENIYDLQITHKYYQLDGKSVINAYTVEDLAIEDIIGIATTYTIDASSAAKDGFYHTKWTVPSGNIKYNTITYNSSKELTTKDLVTLNNANGWQTSGMAAIQMQDRWREYERTLDVFANNGTIQGDSADLEGIGVYTAKTVVAIANTGYEFDRWIIVPTSSNYSINLETPTTATTPVRVSSNVKTNKSNAGSITANFTPISYSITYANMEGATNFKDAPVNYTIESATISLGTPTKTGYQFTGWKRTNAEGEVITEISSGSTGAITLWATWSLDTYTITYLNMEGATNFPSAPSEYNVNTATITLGTPTKTGFAFVKWTENDAQGDVVTSISKGSTGNKVLYANWTTIHVYLEGRTKVIDDHGDTIILNETIDPWDETLKTIEFNFNSADHVYYLNTRFTTYELARYFGDLVSLIKIGLATGDGAVTPYGCNTSNYYRFTPSAKGTEVSSATTQKFEFRNVETYEGGAFTRRGPVMYKYDPSNSQFTYCAPLLTLTYNGDSANVATMSQMKIATSSQGYIVKGLTNENIVYQYKQGDNDWQTWSSDITAATGTYKLRAIASGNNEFGQPVTDVISNEITVTVTTPAISAQVTHVNGNPGSIIRINDSFTIKHTVTGVPADQSVMVCYHWSKKPAGSAIQHDIFTQVDGDPSSVYTSIDVAGDYEIEISIANDVCQDSLSNPDYIKWQTYKLPIHVKGDEITVYARLDTKITDWEKKFVYYWKDAAGTWPGYKMSYIGKDSTDYEWYSYNIDNYKTYQGGKLLFNDSTTRYGQYQTNNVNMPNDDEFYFIKTAMTGGKRDVALDPHIDVTRRVILQTDTTALYQYVTIALEGKGVFLANREEMNYAYAITTKPEGAVAALNAKNQFTPDKAGDYTVTIRCEAGSLSAENTFVLHVQENKLKLTASVGATSTIGTATTVTVSADQAIAGTKTFTVIEPGTNSPITFSTKTTASTSVASDSYTLLSSGMYIFSVVVVNDGKIAGKAQDTVTVAPKTYYIKHPFVNKEAKDIQGSDWSWKQLTYNEIDGTYQYKGDDAYFHPTKVANINTTNSGDKLKEYTIVNPDNLEDKAKCIFVYDITTDKVTVYALNKRLYRIKSTCQDNEYFSNAVTYDDGNPSLTQQVSFFAQKGGALNWQTRETAAHDWVDGTAITTTAAASGIYTATPTKAQTDFSLTAYTDSLFVFSQVVTVNSSEHSPTALNGKLTEFTKKSSSEYYNHYWVRYVEASTQAMATMGNRINNCIATTLPYYVMPAKGNVRYAYDNTTNHFSRTFLAGSGDADFLRVYGERLDTLRKNTADQYDAINSLTNSRKFDDGSDWIYTTKASGEVSTSASVTAILATKYNNMNRWVLAESGLEADPDAKRDILSKDAAKPGRYDLTLIYDYKTNRLTAGAQPAPGTIVSDTMVIDQLILSREGDGSATQFTLADKAKLIVVDKMTVEFDVTKDMYDAWQDEGKGGSGYKIMYFWFSVPYECHINEIYGLGVYGEKFEIQRYRGDLRAAGSAGSSTGSSAWRKLKSTATMEANRGYVIAMRVAASDFKSATIGGETKSIIRLFFPSVGKVELTHEVKTVLQQNESDKTSNLHWNWNIMGNPLVKDGKELIVDSAESAELNFVYVWTWGGGARTYEPCATDEVTLQSTHSYMVQGYGNVYWAYPTVTKSPARYLEAAHFASKDSYGKLNLRLNISQDEQLLDKTYILYREDGDRDEYEMGRDLEKIINSGVTQMYASPNNNLAAVCLNSEDKNMIPLTVIANSDGNYTFSLHRQLNSDLEPTIYDALTQQYTNLSMGSCNVVLTKGTYTNRFFFLLRKTGVVTNMGELNSNNYGEGVQKIILNEQLYILRDGKVYRATGSLVK